MADNFRTGVVQVGGARVLSGTINPASVGVAAPLGSVFCRNDVGSVYVKSGGADTDWSLWTLGGGGGGDLELVGTQIALSDGSSFTFNLLDGEVDSCYELAFHIKRPAATVATNDRILILPNGSTGNSAGVWTQWPAVAAESQLENNRQTISNGMTFSANADDVWGFVKIWAKRNAAGAVQHYRTFTGRAGQSFENGGAPTDGDFRRWYFQGYWRDTASNITSLVLQTANSVDTALTGIGTGSRATLWKRPF